MTIWKVIPICVVVVLFYQTTLLAQQRTKHVRLSRVKRIVIRPLIKFNRVRMKPLIKFNRVRMKSLVSFNYKKMRPLLNHKSMIQNAKKHNRRNGG